MNEPTWQGRYGDALRTQNDIDARFAKEHPVATTLAGMAANMSAFGALGQTAWGARMLGSTEGPLSEMMLRSAATRAAISGSDAAIRGVAPGLGLLGSSAFGAATPVAKRTAELLRMIQNLYRFP